MSRPTDTLLTDLQSSIKSLDARHAKLQSGGYADKCACVPGHACAQHAEIAGLVAQARNTLQEANRAVVLRLKR